ncbi:hypothetical protein Bca52824_022645 [Brassica carinata]|uniref:Uncharacterized protein n=1 Tax=Brassica carinata TaxID=52824 RepID=A0A8X7VGD7_BRACI|nr:hypothetical protein Bca52824_022645 [Brassica carinata]
MVHKQGSLVGRTINLLTDLERLYNMEGLLRDPEKGWRIIVHRYDFCNVVLKIHLYTKEEVENVNDDNKSCLEQAALMIETSKSSSVSQPHSSPTVTRV